MNHGHIVEFCSGFLHALPVKIIQCLDIIIAKSSDEITEDFSTVINVPTIRIADNTNKLKIYNVKLHKVFVISLTAL
jgi:hypothetical protein